MEKQFSLFIQQLKSKKKSNKQKNSRKTNETKAELESRKKRNKLKWGRRLELNCHLVKFNFSQISFNKNNFQSCQSQTGTTKLVDKPDWEFDFCLELFLGSS